MCWLVDQVRTLLTIETIQFVSHDVSPTASAPGISVTGHVTVAGKKIDPVKFRKQIAYVMQDDTLMPTATPREAFAFSASLRLPSTTTSTEIAAMVERTVVELGLESCADTMIGGAMIKGISGGQRKRTSVGVEIITNPAVRDIALRCILLVCV
jgi:ABC-type multidrug transport system ATPase subunit